MKRKTYSEPLRVFTISLLASEKTCSIGLSSGEYAGRVRAVSANWLMVLLAREVRWILALSKISTVDHCQVLKSSDDSRC